MNFEEMLDQLLDKYPDAADEVEALRSKMAGDEHGVAEEAEEMEMPEAEMAMKFKPIPPELMDDEEAAEEDEEESEMY